MVNIFFFLYQFKWKLSFSELFKMSKICYTYFQRLAGKYSEDHLVDTMMTANLFQWIKTIKQQSGQFLFLADLKTRLIRRKRHIQVHTGKPQEAADFPLKERTQKVWRRRNYTRPLPAPSRQFQSSLCNEIKWISLSTEANVQYFE